ncbi:MAG: hypothetical protein RsTaC01_0435 [Candidatus Paraimprobicoccus trichonymphae]|uniref:Lipoprotein n=1 Tax=Candidatus Paraimprobicoccus trichonymphae TaxID=3033793 RepID=A0AA48KXP4_9FIRM|nr:MAG: hypothetical protein RsTaC01_0435 [Candidatus Paraimprobicoccus trichonymphae]
MFNKRINKILAVNLALGLSFAGCNFRAVDTKPHGIAEWVKSNPVKSVLIGLAPFVMGVGSYGGYKIYQYFHKEIPKENSEMFWIHGENNPELEANILYVSEAKIDNKILNHLESSNYYVIPTNIEGKYIIKTKNKQIFFRAKGFNPGLNSNIDYIKVTNLSYSWYCLREHDFNAFANEFMNFSEKSEKVVPKYFYNKDEIDKEIENFEFQNSYSEVHKGEIIDGSSEYKGEISTKGEKYVIDIDDEVTLMNGERFVFGTGYDPSKGEEDPMKSEKFAPLEGSKWLKIWFNDCCVQYYLLEF